MMPLVDLLRGSSIDVVSFGPGAAFAAWLLAGLGATVRHRARSQLSDWDVALFTVDALPAGPAPFEGLEAPVLLTDAPPTPEHRRSLDAAAARRRVVWITPWGLEGPWSDRPATDLLLHAAGGWMSATGEPDREPLSPPGPQGSYVAGLFAAIEVAAGFALPPPELRPGLTEVPAVEAVAATTIYDAVAFQYFGRLRQRTGARYAPTQPTIVTLPCRDGYIGIHATLHRQWLALAQAMGRPELADDPRFRTHADRAAHLAELDAILLPWLARHGRWELFELLQSAGIPAAPTPDVAEVLACDHLEARAAWQEVTLALGQRVRAPRLAIRETARAPHAGSLDGSPGPWRPSALRVLDLSMGWAGPLVGHILACFGADVIKVESRRRFDWWRGSHPDADPALQLSERSHVFNGVNRGKRGVALDLADPEGRDAVRRLACQADVLIENFRPGTLERFGLTFHDLAAENPRLVMLRHSGFGSSGPWARLSAFGNTVESLAGLTAATGYPGGPPQMMSNAYGDPVGGLTATLGVLAALAARGRDGRGRCIEVSQLEAMLPLVSPLLLEFQTTGRVPERRGNARRGALLAGVFPCRGEDVWVALEARTPREASALAELVGASEPAGLERAIAEWCRRQSRDVATSALVAAGVPAAPVHDEADLLAEEPLASRGFWQGEDRAVVGFHLYPSLPLLHDGARPTPGRPAPLLGEHTREVLQALAFDRATLDRICGDQPVEGRAAQA